jgi:hypothetical protein
VHGVMRYTVSVSGEKWKVRSGKWKVKSGKWGVESGKLSFMNYKGVLESRRMKMDWENFRKRQST